MDDKTRAQIVATIGPASAAPETLRAMMHGGMNVARLNLAWGPPEEHAAFIRTIRTEAAKLGIRVPVICDLAGPRVQEGGEHHFGGGSIITEKDRSDVADGIENSADYFAMSYVGSAADIEELRALIKSSGGNTKIIAKIERQEALTNIDGIIAAVDGIMIARGDLGNEVPLEKIPFIEEELIAKANRAKKPVIVATEMMPSMIEGERPTRSDVTDVAYAILKNADAVMLSNETATGKHPVEVVGMMDRIIAEAETHIEKRERIAL